MELYYVDSDYCRYLRIYDALVPYNEGAKKRPFIGIVIWIHTIAFFAPLTSPKHKHQKMKNQMDFLKIENGKLGAVNLNNMIPVQEGLYDRVLFTADEKNDYFSLLQRQLFWCRSHQTMIQKQASLLFQAVTLNRAPLSVKERCCDFYQDMLRLQLYCRQNQLLSEAFMNDFNEEMRWIDDLFYRSDRMIIYV